MFSPPDGLDGSPGSRPNPEPADYDAIVLGGGAAGLMCAIEAGKRGRKTAVIELSPRIGRKIEISGGGRCNFTNLGAGPANYLSENPDFCKSALARYSPADFLALVENHRIPWHEKKLGQLFCDRSARDITGLLLDECASAGVTIHPDCRVSGVSRTHRFQLASTRGNFTCGSLVVATGGLSIPKIGATDFGYRVARQFGHAITDLRPALVGLVWDPALQPAFAGLSGVSLDAVVACDGGRFRENVLVTHRGLSGPAILQISSYWREERAVHLDLLPGTRGAEFLRDHRAEGELHKPLARRLPARFAESWCRLHAPGKPLAQFTRDELTRVGHLLNDWPLTFSASEGYRKAEVTLGGVRTDRISSKTMESRDVPGLYFIGEVVDVTGWLGGYNFQWAWASGFAAGQAV